MMEALYAWAASLAAAGLGPEAWSHPFMVRAAVAGLLLSPLLGALGPLVLSKRLAFFSQAVGHAALTGLALGLLLGEQPQGASLGMVGFCLLVALSMTLVRLHSGLTADAVVGVFLSFSLGLGICLMTLVSRRFDIHQIEAAMFGNILTVGEQDLWVLLGVGAVVGAVLVLQYNRFLLASLDPDLARADGVPVNRLEYMFATLLTLVIVLSLELIGFMLVEGLIVVPAAAARNLAGSTRGYVLGSMLLALVACQAGLAISYAHPVPSGAAITLVLAGIFLGSLLVRLALARRGRVAP